MKGGESAERQHIVVEFRALPGVNGILALRALLKFALRACGLKCTQVRLVDHPERKKP